MAPPSKAGGPGAGRERAGSGSGAGAGAGRERGGAARLEDGVEKVAPAEGRCALGVGVPVVLGGALRLLLVPLGHERLEEAAADAHVLALVDLGVDRPVAVTVDHLAARHQRVDHHLPPLVEGGDDLRVLAQLGPRVQVERGVHLEVALQVHRHGAALLDLRDHIRRVRPAAKRRSGHNSEVMREVHARWAWAGSGADESSEVSSPVGLEEGLLLDRVTRREAELGHPLDLEPLEVGVVHQRFPCADAF